MPTDFSPLRQAPLPDSFGRTAGWLRGVPPPRPSPARPLALAALLALLVGACSWPVETEAVVGYLVEAVASDADAVVRALDAAVPPADRLSVEVAQRGDAEAALYVTLDGAAAEAARRAAERAGADVAVRPLDAHRRQPFGLAAARWLGVTASPRVSDADLQAALDRAFAEHGLAPRLSRDAGGRRVLSLGDAVRIDGLDPETRVARAGSTVSVMGGDLSGLEIGGVPVGRMGRLGPDGIRRALDSAAAAGAPVRAVDGRPARLDTLGLPPEALRALRSIAPDSLRRDSVRFFIRIRDSTRTPQP